MRLIRETLLAAINRHSLIRKQGGIFHGYTKWNVRWNFRWDTDVQGRCAITSVKTALSVHMQLPELDESSEEGRAEFDHYLSDLREHEDGHHDIGAEVARRIDQAIRTLHPCEVVRRSKPKRTGAATKF